MTIKSIWIFLCVLTTGIIGLLFQQYIFFKACVQEVQLLRNQYRDQMVIIKELSRDNSSESVVDGVVDEHAKEQLKQALLTYLKQKDVEIELEDLEELYRSFSNGIKSQADTESEAQTLECEGNSKVVEKGKKPSNKLEKTVLTNKLRRRQRFLTWPVSKDKFWISSFFGKRKLNGGWAFHYGLDMAALKGTPVKAAAEGKVIEVSSNNNGYGNTILLQHKNHYKTRYAHLQRIKVKMGQQVTRGQVIGTVGDTGNVRGNGTDASHLHFEVHVNNKQVNPLRHLG